MCLQFVLNGSAYAVHTHMLRSIVQCICVVRGYLDVVVDCEARYYSEWSLGFFSQWRALHGGSRQWAAYYFVGNDGLQMVFAFSREWVWIVGRLAMPPFPVHRLTLTRVPARKTWAELEENDVEPLSWGHPPCDEVQKCLIEPPSKVVDTDVSNHNASGSQIQDSFADFGVVSDVAGSPARSAVSLADQCVLNVSAPEFAPSSNLWDITEY